MSGACLVVGTMIGSGIFLSPAGILIEVNAVGTSLCVWAACGLLATLGALSYIELGLMVRKSGGPYQYLLAAMGELPAFLYVWTCVMVTRPASFAITALGFAQYVTAPFYPGCEPPQLVQKCAAAFCILSITTINCYSVRLTNAVQVIFTFAKVAVIVAIVGAGLVLLTRDGGTDNLRDGFRGSTTSVSAIAVAFYSGLFSYDGWDQLNYVTEEIKDPVKNFPRVILIGIPSVTLLYILVNIAYFTVITPQEMIASSAVAITFGDRVFGAASFLVPVAVACSSYGAANGSAFSAGRLTYAAGRNGHMMQVLSFISLRRLTPSPALIFNSFIAMIMILPDTSSFSSLINYFAFSSWIFYGGSFLSLIILRWKRPEWERPFKVYLPIPIFCLLCSLYLIVAPIIEDPAIEYLYAACFIMGGLLLYIPIIRYNKHLPWTDHVTSLLQQLLEVVPPSASSSEDSEGFDDVKDDVKGADERSRF